MFFKDLLPYIISVHQTKWHFHLTCSCIHNVGVTDCGK